MPSLPCYASPSSSTLSILASSTVLYFLPPLTSVPLLQSLLLTSSQYLHHFLPVPIPSSSTLFILASSIVLIVASSYFFSSFSDVCSFPTPSPFTLFLRQHCSSQLFTLSFFLPLVSLIFVSFLFPLP